MCYNVLGYASNTKLQRSWIRIEHYVAALRDCFSSANTMLGRYEAAVIGPITWVSVIRVLRYPRCENTLLLVLMSFGHVFRTVPGTWYVFTGCDLSSTWYSSIIENMCR